MFNYKDTIMSCRFIHTCHHIIAIGMYSICEVAYIGIESPTTKIFFQFVQFLLPEQWQKSQKH